MWPMNSTVFDDLECLSRSLTLQTFSSAIFVQLKRFQLSSIVHLSMLLMRDLSAIAKFLDAFPDT